MFRPQLFQSLRTYTWNTFFTDMSAGLIVGIVALPLAIAFAIASGVTPEKGLITAVVAGFLISALGGSRVQIGGPTGAFVVTVYDVIQHYGIKGLMIATVMAGIMLVIFGLARFGSAIKFVPYPVIVGFTTGIALIIFTGQIKDVLGLKIGALPSDFFEKIYAIATHIDLVNWYALGITVACLMLILLWQHIFPKIPGSLVALLLSTIVVHFFHLPVETIGSRFGDIQTALPTLQPPPIDWNAIKHLLTPAITIALLAGIEALLSAVVADGMTGYKHNSNTELIAQGIANIFSPLFGGIPATGAIARTATNIKNGAQTPVAGIIHALTLLLIMLFLGQWAELIPMPCLGAILIVVSYNMSEWRSFMAVLRSPRSDAIVLVATFLLTVIIDLTFAIQVGVVASAFMFMRRMALVSNVGVMTREFADDQHYGYSIDRSLIPADTDVFEINGPFFFGAAYKFKEAMDDIKTKPPKVRIIEMHNVPAIDSTGLHILEEVHGMAVKRGIILILSGITTQPYTALEKAGLLSIIGEKNIFGSIHEAIARAEEIIKAPQTIIEHTHHT